MEDFMSWGPRVVELMRVGGSIGDWEIRIFFVDFVRVCDRSRTDFLALSMERCGRRWDFVGASLGPVDPGEVMLWVMGGRLESRVATCRNFWLWAG
jgi:hypothetical protein